MSTSNWEGLGVLASWIESHGFEAVRDAAGDERGWFVWVTVPWFKPATQERGEEYVKVRTLAEARELMGY